MSRRAPAKFGIDGEHALERKRRLVRLAAVERGYAEQIIVADVPRELVFVRRKQVVCIGGAAALHELLGLVEIRFCGVNGLASRRNAPANSASAHACAPRDHRLFLFFKVPSPFEGFFIDGRRAGLRDGREAGARCRIYRGRYKITPGGRKAKMDDFWR